MVKICNINGELIHKSEALDMRGAVIEAVKGGVDLTGADLSNANLLGVSISGATLQGANFYRSKLKDADLSACDLRGAILDDACLAEANLSAAKLEGASLYCTNFQEACIAQACLDKANLRGACLFKTNASKSSMRNAILDEVTLEEANLEEADLYGADLEEANLRDANLSRAELPRANLYCANLEGANLQDTDLSGANLYGAHFNGSFLQGAKMEHAYLNNAHLVGACIYKTDSATPDSKEYMSHSLCRVSRVDGIVLKGKQAWGGDDACGNVVLVRSFELLPSLKKRHNSRSFACRPKDTTRVLSARRQRYGSFEGHAAISQALQKVVYEGFAKREDGKTAQDMTDAQREALFMILHKVARIVNGDFNYDDSWRDIAGYATLVTNLLDKEKTE